MKTKVIDTNKKQLVDNRIENILKDVPEYSLEEIEINNSQYGEKIIDLNKKSNDYLDNKKKSNIFKNIFYISSLFTLNVLFVIFLFDGFDNTIKTLDKCNQNFYLSLIVSLKYILASYFFIIPNKVISNNIFNYKKTSKEFKQNNRILSKDELHGIFKKNPSIKHVYLNYLKNNVFIDVSLSNSIQKTYEMSNEKNKVNFFILNLSKILNIKNVFMKKYKFSSEEKEIIIKEQLESFNIDDNEKKYLITYQLNNGPEQQIIINNNYLDIDKFEQEIIKKNNHEYERETKILGILRVF